MAPIQAFLFGDQTINAARQLRHILRDTSSPSLVSFFEQALHALRYEFSKLPATQRRTSFRFSTLEELLDLQIDEHLPTIFEPALTCLYELAVFIRYHDQNGKRYPQGPDVVLAGLCTGALPAAVVSCSTSIPELVEAGVQAVLAGFRTGVCVADMAKRLQSEVAHTAESWSILFVDVDSHNAQVALQQDPAIVALPSVSRPWISSIAPRGVTISGNPTVLGRICSVQPFRDAKAVKLPIRGPFHAAHLYGQEDVQTILMPLSDASCLTWGSNHTVISSFDGRVLHGETLKDMLQDALEDILRYPIHYVDITKGMHNLVKSKTAESFSLCPINTNAADGICTGLKELSTDLPNEIEIFQHFVEEPSTIADHAKGHYNRSKIAIIGLSGRYPSGENNEEFWDLLHQGLDVHKEVPPSHWDVKTHVDLEGKKKNTSATPYGCWLDNPGLWDARFFNISPREAPQIDPAQRLALLTAYEAIEQAGIVPGATPSTEKDRVGVFYGVTSNDWMETNSAQAIDTYFIPGGNRAFIPGRVNYFFKFSGPSYAIDTACSSSLAGIHIACNALWRGDVDTAIAGGTNILTNPDFTAGLDRGHFLSRTGNCKTFDDDADGYCRGEAVGTVILKRLEDALADKDPIQGVILGAYTNHSAEADSITRPHPEAQKEIFRRILNQAGIDPKDVSYIECHGTGTQAGDAGEMESVLSVFAPKHGRQTPLYLGSAKANIGHGEGASGISSLAKVLLMMQKNNIPPHCGIKTRINHRFPTDLEQRNVHIARQVTPWHRTSPDKVRRVFVNNFSAAGGNSAIVLEDAPVLDNPDASKEVRTSHPVAISAKSSSSMAANLKSLLTFLENAVDEDGFLAQLSYTTTARRIHHPHRVMLNGANLTEIKVQLHHAITEEQGKNRPKSAPKLVFAFTGQGAQYPGMGKELFETFSLFRQEMMRLDQLARSLGFPSFLPLLEATTGDVGDFSPVVVQLAAVCMQVALAKLWESWGIIPSGGVVGHSLGEYAALNVAGVLSDVDTIYLVGKRAELLVEKCTAGSHAMLAVLSTLEQITNQLTAGDCTFEVACLNAPREVVLSGKVDDMAKAGELLKSQGIKATLLNVPYAFHSSQVEPILDDFEALAAGVNFRKPRVAVISPLLSKSITDSDIISPGYLARHCRATVNLVGALSTAAKDSKSINDDSIFVEFGPHPVVSGLVKATLGQQIRTVSSLRRNKSTWQPLTSALASLYTAGVDIRWAEYHRDFPWCHRVVQLPAYNWDLKEYWMQYVNDWSLRKGDPLPTISQVPSLATTTVHSLVKETGDDKQLTLIVESDISRPDLNPLVQGHRVNGIPLCTPSVYADIALTIGNYIVKRYRFTDELVDVGKLAVEKALIAKPKGPQILRTTVKVDLKAGTGKIVFSSIDDKGNTTRDHASCVISFIDRSELAQLQSQMPQIQQRVRELQKDLESGQSYRFNSKMAYLMVLGVAQFHEDYRCIDEVILNSSNLEAVGWIDLAKAKKGGSFTVHPAYVDAMTQLGGFVMNANDGADLDKEVFINHGWKSSQIYRELQPDKKYRNYVKMVPKEGNMFEGDVVIFDGDDVVACFKGVELQGVPRRVLHYILAAESGGGNSVAPQPARPPQAQSSTKPAVAPPASSSPSAVAAAMKIVEEESGIDAKELSDNAAWADIGVDSLLSLVISSRFKEELSIDIDSSDFLTMPTVGDLKVFLGQQSTPALSLGTPPPLVQDFPVMAQTTASSGSFDFEALKAIISEESGVALQDLSDDTNFADIGIDSLLTLVITSRCSEELGLDLDGQSRVFLEHPTIGDLHRYFFSDSNSAGTPAIVSPGVSDGTTTPESSTPSPFTPPEPDTLATPMTEMGGDPEIPTPFPTSGTKLGSPRATSVVLQGKPATAKRTIIFFPDGSGSAYSYSQLPRISHSVCVIGLNCPFLRDPSGLRSLNLDDVIDIYLAEVRARQPHGPYHLGGWSSGGIFAFRAAQRLIEEEGETVASLVLIDSPVPRGMDRLPARFYQHLERHGVFGRQAPQSFQQHERESAGNKPPEWLVPHFNATIDLLETFYADPLVPEGRVPVPKTSIIWAGESVLDGVNVPKLQPGEDDTEGMKFLSEKRTDFSAGGWGDLFPGMDVSVGVIREAHHFSMMRGQHAEKLVAFIRDTIA